MAAALSLSLLAGCGSDRPVGSVGYVKGFGGAVAADEPRAVLAARDVLSAGGTAADAAVALYFSLAVTLPSTASLGGGGACVVHDPATKTTEVLDFRAPAASGGGQLAVGVPANARGFFALQAKYGKMRWESLLAGPERMAREGVAVSRALANDLAQGSTRLVGDPEARRVFFRDDGHVLAEGDRMENYDLAATLSWLRRAPGEFYVGQLARQVAAAADTVGAGLTATDMRNLRPRFIPGETLALGHDTAYLPPPRRAEAARTAVRTQLASASGDVPAFTPADKAPGTGFVVLDSYGGAVACAVSANGLFGTGRMAPGTGMLLAAAPSGAPPAVPVMLVNPNNDEVHFAAAAGGSGDPSSDVMAALRASAGGRSVGQVVAGAASRVNAFACDGKPSVKACAAATDPKGFGYSVVLGRD